MRYGDKCKSKGAKMKNNSPAVMQLINNANFLLNVCFHLVSTFEPNFRVSIRTS